MTLDEVVDNFSFLEDWEDKYKYLIDLGEGIPPFPDYMKTEENKVEGCMSQVWLTYNKSDDTYFFRADSDALIVKGLIAIIVLAYSAKTKEEIKGVDIRRIFKQLGLNNHLSPTRRNGFFSMVKRINEIALRK